jgi:hypothetical protein
MSAGLASIFDGLALVCEGCVLMLKGLGRYISEEPKADCQML